MRDPQFDKLQKLLAIKDLSGAEMLCRRAIKRNRNDVNMIAVLGVILARSGRIDEAEKNLKRAIQLAPRFAKPHDDLASIHMRRKEFAKAESLFRKAAELQPDMESAQVGLAHALKEQGNLEEARKICGQIMEHSPANLNVIRLMAAIESAAGRPTEAGRLLQLIVEKAPDSVRAVTDCARFHAEQYDHEQAINFFRRAVELDPQDSKLHLMLAGYLLMMGFSEQALTAFDAGLRLNPNSPSGRSGRLYALRNLGETEQVIAGCRDCIDQGLNVSESWWSLSSLRTYTFTDDDIDNMQVLRQSESLPDFDAAYLDFAIGKAMDDHRRYDDAWVAYERANAGRRKAVQYDSAEQRDKVNMIIDAVDNDMVTGIPGSQPHSGIPIFLVGMPRSGSTLVEQILASHSGVEATTELPYMLGLGESYLLAETGEVPRIRDADEDLKARIGDAYLRAVDMHRSESKPYFTDKQPENFMYAGLIAISLPYAIIIDVRRNPLDTCVGNFRQWFGNGKEFSYDLDELADYYLQYRRLMRHWKNVMPGRVLEIRYEELVNDTEAQIRRMLEHCGLPWESACLNFHEADRVVTTASSEQVRQPIYKGAIGFWKNYEKHLDPLKELLSGTLDT